MRETNPLIVALDVFDADSALSLVRRLRGAVGAVKVGLQLYTAVGPDLLRGIEAQDVPVFLDLKFHDIPNTVALACRAAAEQGARMLTLHTSGGRGMLRAAADAMAEYEAESGKEPPLLLGVTVLTSLDDGDLRDVGVARGASDQVVALARIAENAGLDGVVASAREAALVREACGDRFLIVTPGIRPSGAAHADQKRTATPREARDAGADFLVVGRPITAAPDPAAAARAILGELR